ncbi:tyrosine-type recombinase/integrase [Dysgonomonas sp. GY75]|uniref:tyrosine-type recombinase/integrase n=1 Tax=Dysgonomonas sp. GY75 TaxID=2780419 RepID=UPI0018847F59|nr:tyrosine-type recombinase/integrase [Dysgonomonas sp. GY75]MBF0651274.1 tyrosine-type recombinase/integrase [Dysgonomonas sp. GY75]
MLNFFSKNKAVTIQATAFIYEFCRKSKRDSAYKRKYRNIANKLAAFESDRGISILSNSFNSELAEDFICFLQNQNLKHNTIRQLYDGVAYMFRLMGKRGYAVNFSFEEINIDKEESTQVYLMLPELHRLYSLNIRDKNVAKIRDLFLIGCFTGLRFSDYSRIDTANFDGKIIKIKTKKTGVIVQIPANSYVRDIMARYNGNIEYRNSLYNFNCRIKTLCRRAGINDKILVEYTRGHKAVRESKRKYELVGSHVARRSFATNAYLAGIPAARIMLLTGHQSEQSFFKYIRIQKAENAKTLADHPFFK